MLMRRHIGVEVGTSPVDDHLAQKASIGELVQSVVDRCQGDRDAFAESLIMKHFSPEVTIVAIKKEMTQCEALPRWAQFGFLEGRQSL